MLLPLLLLLAQQPPAATQPGPAVEAAVLTTSTGDLSGTLMVPQAAAPMPVALIVAGSGPTDRDGNSQMMPGRNDTYLKLAEALAAQGIASLRYDKRGIGASRAAATSEADLRFETYVDDAAGWVGRLRTDRRFSRIVIIGHSEGSLVGMLAAEKVPVDGFVSVAGVAQRASEVLRAQLRPQIGTSAALWDGSETVLKSLEAGMPISPLPSALRAVPQLALMYRPSVQPYVISWFKYVPSDVLATLKVPTLIVQGTTDIQVGVDQARALGSAKPDARLVIVNGMNHLLREAPADPAGNIATYSKPELPLVPDAVSAIVDFVQKPGGR